MKINRLTKVGVVNAEMPFEAFVKKNLTAVHWRSIIFGHNHPPSGTTATYGKLLPPRKRRLALSFLGVNKTSPNVKKKSVENFIVHYGLWAWQPNGVLLGKILSANIEEQVHL